MKSEILESNQVKFEYPQLRQHNTRKSMVVLFTNEKSGVVVATDDETRPLGMRRKDWIEDSFIPLNGSVILSN